MTEHRLIDQDANVDDIEYEDVPADRRWTLALDTDGDLRFDDTMNRLHTTSGTEAVSQSLKVAIATVIGEDPIDPGYGLDVFTATRSDAHLEREIRRTLLYDDANHSRVAAVDEINIIRTPGSRRPHVDVTVTLDSGDITELQFDLGMQ